MPASRPTSGWEAIMTLDVLASLFLAFGIGLLIGAMIP